MLRIRTIPHPTDFSEAADFAYREALMIARDCKARLVVLHVAGLHLDLPHPMHTELGIAFDCSGDYQSHHADLKAQLYEQFETNPDLRVETQLIYGGATEEILRVAGEIRCDLIVMGTHGRSGLSRLLMGSVAEGVLRRAHCPVLTVSFPTAEPSAGSSEPAPEAATT